MMSDQLLELRQVSARIMLGNGEQLTTVRDVNLTLNCGTSYSVVGKSGSGKTSLVSILGLLNSKFEGRYIFDGKDITSLSDRKRSLLRASKIGFVFQNYSLISHLTVKENVQLALDYSKRSGKNDDALMPVKEVLEKVGLSHKLGEYPNRLSGGEQQRVAIARALSVKPKLLICDEPTGALDTETSAMIMELLLELVRSTHVTLALVTHDKDIADLCDEQFVMRGGEISRC